MSRNRPLLPSALTLRALTLTHPEDDTAELRAIARENTSLFLQIAVINDAVLDADSSVKETDRAALLSLCDMDMTELQIYAKMVESFTTELGATSYLTSWRRK